VDWRGSLFHRERPIVIVNNYDDLYSIIRSTPFLGCLQDCSVFTISAISNAWDYRESTVLTVFEGRKDFGCRKTVPGAWTSNMIGLIVLFSLGAWHENIRGV